MKRTPVRSTPITEVGSLYDFMKLRHTIYLRRKDGEKPPWTGDPILQKYKFTNVYRELDRTTLWMRKFFTGPNEDAPHDIILFNCCVFRMFGSINYMDDLGWINDHNDWDPRNIIAWAEQLLADKERVFTGAYIVPNMGISESKVRVVVLYILNPIWDNRKKLAKIAKNTQSLQKTHAAFRDFKGWGGNGFMAYEVISDLRWTPVLRGATDILTWANPGPGCRRGLNRVFDRPVKSRVKPEDAILEMQELFADISSRWPGKWPSLEMREIEHSLCEFDKYERARLGEGRPRSRFTPHPKGLPDW